jgi:hypothetical protein
VKAGGEDGFNVHFHDIEDEFKKLSDVVHAIKDRMDQLAEKPTARPITTTLTPALVPSGVSSATTTGPVAESGGWEQTGDGQAKKPNNTKGALGTMSVDLPHGATIQSLRAVGEIGGNGILTIELRRRKLDPTHPHSESVVGVVGSRGGFDNKNPPEPAMAVVDTETFRYYVVAEVTDAAPADTVVLDAFQVVHVAQ